MRYISNIILRFLVKHIFGIHLLHESTKYNISYNVKILDKGHQLDKIVKSIKELH